MIVELIDVDKSYQEGDQIIPILKKINFSVKEGEFVAIMGPSGSGKSTMMNLIGCLDKATAGKVLIDDQDVEKMNDDQLAELRLRTIGFVFQTFELLPYETARENVALPLIYAGVSKEERRQRAEAALDMVGLSDRMSFMPNQLSGGQKQRVAIARAMVNNPKILLADEPTGALDSTSGMQVLDLFRDLHEKGVTILMITHDPNVAARAERIVEIRDGKLKDQEETV
ncbi:MAG: ABC transporter ATP-binding protein [Eubacterium sp.]|nr:ABC transporter ATP-binding protein [Eubacterium sp.]